MGGRQVNASNGNEQDAVLPGTLSFTVNGYPQDTLVSHKARFGRSTTGPEGGVSGEHSLTPASCCNRRKPSTLIKKDCLRVDAHPGRHVNYLAGDIHSLFINTDETRRD
jgi:hypothetical protein